MKALLTASTVLVLLGHAKAAAPEEAKPFTAWTLMVIDQAKERHEYAVSRDGGPIKLDIADWKCSYDPVSAQTRSSIYSETIGITCSTSKHSASTLLTCFSVPSRIPQMASLTVMTGGKSNLINLGCEPH